MSDFDGTTAAAAFAEKVRLAKKKKGREERGDELAPMPGDGFEAVGSVFATFGSLFQGDHLGVEFALASHEQLLQQEGLLQKPRRILGHFTVPVGPVWEALVIDDYFCISSDPVSMPATSTETFKALATARDAYDRHKLEGSHEKDVIAEEKFKAAGAEVDSRISNVKQGLVSVSAPLSKRIGLSTLSLRAACLPIITSKLASRLAGNWVSVLLYRRCLSSVVDSFFGIAASCEASSRNVAVTLNRGVAEELVTLAALVPLIASNVALPFSSTIFASDASNSSGAVVSSTASQPLSRLLWLGGDKKGGYTKLDEPLSSLPPCTW